MSFIVVHFTTSHVTDGTRMEAFGPFDTYEAARVFTQQSMRDNHPPSEWNTLLYSEPYRTMFQYPEDIEPDAMTIVPLSNPVATL